MLEISERERVDRDRDIRGTGHLSYRGGLFLHSEERKTDF
jgi:hypothetical protein